MANVDRTSTEQSIRMNLAGLVLKAAESGGGDYLNQEDDGELNGILPDTIASNIRYIDVPRHRDGYWGDIMDVHFTDGSLLSVKLSQTEKDLCKKTYDNF